MLAGFSRIHVLLSQTEFDKIWDDVTNNNNKLERIDYKLFKIFFEKYSNKK